MSHEAIDLPAEINAAAGDAAARFGAAIKFDDDTRTGVADDVSRVAMEDAGYELRRTIAQAIDERPMLDCGERGAFYRAVRDYGNAIAEAVRPDPDLSDEDRTACAEDATMLGVLRLVGLTMCPACQGNGAWVSGNGGVSECEECGGDGVAPLTVKP